ncbi:hypothetical protein PRUPE_4G261100 [Prunus persica]|uniref:Uncharacterized protein n=1 Tax=Prunus persica TaxID=3760 RepID=A0A251PRA2_PRUPE|nr:hypothetical protein PRUPE_4G261100 [Prunus persica]
MNRYSQRMASSFLISPLFATNHRNIIYNHTLIPTNHTIRGPAIHDRARDVDAPVNTNPSTLGTMELSSWAWMDETASKCLIQRVFCLLF